MSSTLQKISQLEQKPDTKQVLTDLFQENTGRHMLDSGGAYGRNWEKNNNMEDLEEEKPRLTLDLWYREDNNELEIIPSVSTFHRLLDHAEFDQTAFELTKIFHEYAQTNNTNRSWLTEMTEFVEDHTMKDKEAHATNTYNHEFNHADQILQFIPVTVHHADSDEPEHTEVEYDLYGEYVIIQVHGGCDVRGGYTAPIVLNTYEATRLMSVGDYLTLETEDGTHLFEGAEHRMYPNLDEVDEVKWNEDAERLEAFDGEKQVYATVEGAQTEVSK